jgi:hypothetical protein
VGCRRAVGRGAAGLGATCLAWHQLRLPSPCATTTHTPHTHTHHHTTTTTTPHHTPHTHHTHTSHTHTHTPQERAPTSVAYAENQSMVLDALASDAAWLGRYARDRQGAPMPWELAAQQIEATHPYEVFQVRRGAAAAPAPAAPPPLLQLGPHRGLLLLLLRIHAPHWSPPGRRTRCTHTTPATLAPRHPRRPPRQVRAMLAVPYLEKALYEVPEGELSVEALLALADRVEERVQGGLSPRPLLSVPHILADEASCYCGWRGRGDGAGGCCGRARAAAAAAAAGCAPCACGAAPAGPLQAR